MFRRQFLLTVRESIPLGWERWEVGNRYLFCHPDLNLTYSKSGDNELFLLGSMYDWEKPEYSDQQILDVLASSVTIETIFSKVSKFCGQFVLIYRSGDTLIVLNDACSQSEIYYTTDYSNIATQPKLLAEVTELIPYSEGAAREFYQSKVFGKKCLFVGDSTHMKKVKHLMPNHFIDVKEQKVERFFPVNSKKERPVQEVTERVSVMLKGYIKAISNRHKVTVGVTAGVDSRVLFLASLDEDCHYYVNKKSDMDEDHHDIAIPKKLTKLFNKDFEVVNYKIDTNEQVIEEFTRSVDFPLFWSTVKEKNPEKVIVNGNVSEVARNYYGYHKNLSGEDLAFLNGYRDQAFPIKKYKEWLKLNKPLFEHLGYNYLDMFYWEEKMGNWLAKAITESNAMGRNLVSPFNSRDLLTLLLSTKREYRDSHFNKLYDHIFDELSKGKKELKDIPINPTGKQAIIRMLKRFRIYNTYKFIGLKTRLY